MKKKRASSTNGSSTQPPPPSAGDFERLLNELTPHTPATGLLIAVYIGLFVLMWVSGVPAVNRLPHHLIKYGANIGPFTTNGEGWRLLTCVFLQTSIFGLIATLWVLWSLGHLLEKLVGSIGFALLYVLCGFSGSLAGAVWRPDSIEAGSAGAVFGLVAAYLALVPRCRGTVPAGTVRRCRRSVLVYLAYTIGYEQLLMGHVDFCPPLGGAAAGFVCGLILGQSVTRESLPNRPVRAVVIFFLAVILAVGAAMTPRIASRDRAYTLVRNAEDVVAPLYAEAARRQKEGKIDYAAVAQIVETEILPRWRETAAKLHDLGKPLPEDKELLDMLNDYVKLREQAWEILIEGIHTSSDETIEQSRKKMSDAERLSREFREKLDRTVTSDAAAAHKK